MIFYQVVNSLFASLPLALSFFVEIEAWTRCHLCLIKSMAPYHSDYYLKFAPYIEREERAAERGGTKTHVRKLFTG